MNKNALALSIQATQIPVVIETCYDAGLTPAFVGKPGIAKTDMVRRAAALLAKKYGEPVAIRELHLASMSEVDVRGYLIPNGDRAEFTKPEFWAAIEASPRGILFLDEFMQASHELQKAVAPLIYERRIGEWYLPPGWIVAVAGNGVDDSSGANTLLSHVLSRLMYVHVTAPDVDEWVIWAVNEGLPPELIAFAKLRPQLVFDAELPQAEDTPYCTPRTVHLAGKAANAFPGGMAGMVTCPTGMAMLAGQIGRGAAGELAAIVKTASRIAPFEQMMAEPDTCPVPTELDEQYAAVMLVAVRAKHADHAQSAVEYLTRFPINITLVGIVSLVNRDALFLQSRALMKWAQDNRQLLGKFQKFINIR